MIFNRIEKYLFPLLVASHLIPLLALGFFVTHDGPAHTYNTVLIEDLLSQDTKPASVFFQFNPDPVPNWGYNAIMLITDKLVSPAVSERLIIALIILVIAFSFRALIRQINPENSFQSFLVLPFLFSFHLYIGFFNFCIGSSLFFFLLYYMVKKRTNNGLAYYFLLGGISLLLLFSHAFSFMLFCICLKGYLIVETKYRGQKLFSSYYLKKIVFHFLALLPSLLFCIYFLTSRYDVKGIAWLDLQESFRYIYECGPAITLTYEPERIYGITIFVLTVLNIGFVIHAKRKLSGKLNRHDLWLVISLVTLILYFLLPNTMGVWGFISLRTLMFFFLFLPLWFASSDFPQWWKFTQVGVMTLLIVSRLNYQYGLSKNLNNDVMEMVSIKDKIRPGSVILPLDYYTNWMHDNISNYLGMENKNVVLDNYEAVFPHFPLMLKNETNPYTLLGNFSGRTPPCADIDKFENEVGLRIDYVLRWMYHADEDSCTASVNKIIEEKFVLKAKSPNGMAELFERKK